MAGSVAFLFPGQGSAAVGMGVEIAEASTAAAGVLDRLDALHPALRRLRESGPVNELIRTANAQPAIFAVDCACLAALEERGAHPDLAAGHSLGEYAALVAASVLDLETGFRLVLRRGALMERATAEQPGTMVAVLGIEPERVAQIVEVRATTGVISLANDNAPGQIVVSGDAETLRSGADDLRAAGARVMSLPVGGAFHSDLMRPAEEDFLPMLEETVFVRARIPVVSNSTAEPSRDDQALKAALRAQMTGRVRWRESIEAMMNAGVDTFVEVGPGKVLTGLVQRCTRGRSVQVLNVEDAASLERTVSALSHK